MNSLFSNLAVQYPAINEIQFKPILENTLAPVNIFKLSTDYTPDHQKKQIFKVSQCSKRGFVSFQG